MASERIINYETRGYPGGVCQPQAHLESRVDFEQMGGHIGVMLLEMSE